MRGRIHVIPWYCSARERIRRRLERVKRGKARLMALEKFVGTGDDGWAAIIEESNEIGVITLEPGSPLQSLLLELWRKETGEVISAGWPAEVEA